jgi:hypothetical protein
VALTIKLVRHGESLANTGEMVAHEVAPRCPGGRTRGDGMQPGLPAETSK